MLLKDPIVLFCNASNIPYYASYLHLLFSKRNLKSNAYVNLNIEKVTESSKKKSVAQCFCNIVHIHCNVLIIEMTVVDMLT